MALNPGKVPEIHLLRSCQQALSNYCNGTGREPFPPMYRKAATDTKLLR